MAPKILAADHEKIKQEFIYDLSSASCISKVTAGGQVENAGRLNGSGYYFVVYDCAKVLCHHLVMILHDRLPMDYQTQVDHIDRNRQNNRIENLRWVTASTNLRNRRRMKPGCRYVYFDGINGKYRSQWRHPVTKQLIFVGIYDTVEDASFYAKVHRAEMLGNSAAY